MKTRRKKDSKLQINKETLRELEGADLPLARGGLTGDPWLTSNASVLRICCDCA
jgi:hypothetical protein